MTFITHMPVEIQTQCLPNEKDHLQLHHNLFPPIQTQVWYL